MLKPIVVIVLALLHGAASLAAQELSALERDIVARVDTRADEAVALLERVVNINSGTLNAAGVRAVGAVFADELAALGFATRWAEMPAEMQRAGHLIAERRGERGKRLLLIGHLDTVFEPGDPFDTFVRADTLASGPGVTDMKGGDVAMLMALKALNEVGALEGTTITVVLIGDEEKAGAPIAESRRDLIEAGRRSDVALGFENGEPGRVVASRRGSSNWTLRTSGKRAHSSRIFNAENGSGAIFEAARILHRFHDEVRGPDYLTFNPGIILGGTDVTYEPEETRGTAFGKTNVIAQSVVVDGGLRFLTEEQKEEARHAMRAIVEDHLPRTDARIEFQDRYPAMAPTEGNLQLLSMLDEINRALGGGPVDTFDPSQRGAADVSFVAPFLDGLDGLGVFGSALHTPQETVDLRSLPIVTRRAAILIHRLTR